MTAILERRESTSLWGRFCNWITSTENRLYIGWFGVLMIPTLLTATSVFIIAFIAAPPVDIDGIREPVSGSLLYGNNIISGAIIPTSAAIGLHFYPIWEAASVDEWLYNGGPYELIVLHFLLGVACYMGREWELSFRLGMRPWIAVAYSAPVAAATAVFLIYPIGQGSFSDGMPLGISGTFNFMIVFQAEHNILMHPFHMLGVAGVFGGSLFSAMHGSLVTSSLIRETTENESANEGYRFGQEEETYNIVAAHGYFGRLIFQYASFNNSRSLHFFLAAWPVVGIWFTALGISTMAFNLNGFNFNQSVVDSQGRVINTWADIINRANLGMEVMHERRLPSQHFDPALPKLFRVTPTLPTCPTVAKQFWDIKRTSPDATLGGMFLCGANDLITIFVAPECFSFCSYLLSGYTKRDVRSNEATMKYLLMGGASSSILVHGFSWLYGSSGGEIELQEIVNGLINTQMYNSPGISIALIFITVGIGFKLSPAPFHQWTPDVYEGVRCYYSWFSSFRDYNRCFSFCYFESSCFSFSHTNFRYSFLFLIKRMASSSRNPSCS
ncbi:hypothetical protein LUZ63_022011 [Rhynchospora breviuscula]|uniref:Photosystem II protein D1 n=1 Tax=Rhynchospora breviuscula TaxID=2022672 RepID=A0A9P9Z706_9POAL|nr:hypothetical protein LUZ63_022399 [Rhynchospora breviuscula]KAJ1682767.1 hypothetical protein LUZ63_022011 [Rhynchospora breviuscula]